MIDIEKWMADYREKVLNFFGERVLFIGLQGSFGRNEAHEKSDIDVVLILESLKPQDLKSYREILDTLPERNRICGFVAGKKEIVSWSPSDLFQFWNDTRPYYGNLKDFSTTITRNDIRQAILTGSCNIYHACCHNYLHERDFDILKNLCKTVFFILQAVCYSESGRYIQKYSDLKEQLSDQQRDMLEYTQKVKEDLTFKMVREAALKSERLASPEQPDADNVETAAMELPNGRTGVVSPLAHKISLLKSEINLKKESEILLEDCSVRLMQWAGEMIQKYHSTDL